MASDSIYCYEGNDNFFIENGILKGHDEPYLDQHTSYGELILERLKNRPEFVGQVNGVTGEEENFAVMMEKSIKCAIWLKKQNVNPGDVIGICTHNQMDMYVPCFASLFIGAIFNPWCDAGINQEMARYFLELTRPKVLFVNEATATVALEVSKEIGMKTKIIVFGKISGFQSLSDIIESENDVQLVAEFSCTKLSSVDDPAVIIFTSGTTGLPMGALHSHRSLFGNLKLRTNLGRNEHAMTTLMFSSLSWISGIFMMLRGIVSPERRIIYPEYTEEKALELIEKFQVNWMLIGTSMAFRLQKSPLIPNYDLSSLKFVLVGGAILKKETQERLAETFPQTRFFQTYGATELGGAGVRQTPDFKPSSCGKPVKNLTMKVIDPENGRILAPNETGEMCFKSPFLFKCYYGNPEATRNAVDSEGWFHTGDLGHYDEEGNIFVTDRLKELIKYRGYHVSPAMIEQVLQTHPGVKEIAVLGVPDDLDDEHPIAFVTKAPNSKVTKEELENIVAGALPDYMKLRGGVIFLDELPHTSSGKVSRTELRKLAKSHAHGE